MLRLALAVCVALVALAPPGLCPCWLIADVRHIHPHPSGEPDRPHPHDYLFEMFQTQPAHTSEPPLHPTALIEHLKDRSVWQAVGDYARVISGWSAAPPTPPPRWA